MTGSAQVLALNQREAISSLFPNKVITRLESIEHKNKTMNMTKHEKKKKKKNSASSQKQQTTPEPPP